MHVDDVIERIGEFTTMPPNPDALPARGKGSRRVQLQKSGVAPDKDYHHPVTIRACCHCCCYCSLTLCPAHHRYLCVACVVLQTSALLVQTAQQMPQATLFLSSPCTLGSKCCWMGSLLMLSPPSCLAF